MIELFNITKTFNAGKQNEFTALRGLSVSLDINQITALKGPSGSGKTTLLSIIACMARPTSGRMMFQGREITSLPERFLSEIRRKTFGFIFQSFNLIKGLSVLENTMIPAYPMGIKYRVIKERAMVLLEKLNIASKAHQRVEHLSGGEQQRTAMARALINEPAIVIADEPTAHLDTELAESFMYLISVLHAEGKTILIASHDPLVFEADIVHRVIELRDGEIRKERRTR
ncbi:MAG: ABC transporter ATP-binding protein [Deltaproteobacteria bacterium]|nr:ABC transporter ATP-binding protein [Deltaproteobacteria bacterium]MBW2309016.1 ABC transporter ATP-binding protein [Deltaproteobacteria bacterium]